MDYSILSTNYYKLFFMKRLILILSLLPLFLSSKAQSESAQTFLNDSISVYTAYLVDNLVTLEKEHTLSERYKIYPTENLYILIKLDTQTGKLDLIQWSLKSKDEFNVTLNASDLSVYTNLNSFELYPTKNMYQFILLDKATGRNWHVQWGTKDSERWIRRIY